jgi:hypothetical protein
MTSRNSGGWLRPAAMTLWLRMILSENRFTLFGIMR